MNYYFEEHAREELRDAVAYYEAIDSDLGSSFSTNPPVSQRLAAAVSQHAPVSHEAISLRNHLSDQE